MSRECHPCRTRAARPPGRAVCRAFGRVPGGVQKVTVTLNRDNGKDAMTLRAQMSQDEDSVQALLAFVRTLADPGSAEWGCGSPVS